MAGGRPVHTTNGPTACGPPTTGVGVFCSALKQATTMGAQDAQRRTGEVDMQTTDAL